jgi:hypothetical protein
MRMDFIDRIHEIALHIPEKVPNIQSEETTKTALIQPFIQALGYDISDPTEVKAELTLDMGGVKADRIDYAIFNDNKAIILIECKSCDIDINRATFKQLKKYFAFTNAKFGILTNGIKYRFFSDLANPGKMDDVHFLELDMLNVKDSIVAVVKNFSNPMDERKASEIADDLKCKGEIRAILEREFNKPSKEFVLFFASQILNKNPQDRKKKLVKSVVRQFCEYTKETCDEFIQDKIDDFVNAAKNTAKGMALPPLIDDEPIPDKVKYFIFNGERFEVKFWKDMLPKICSIMASKHKDQFEEVLNLRGYRNPYFSKNKEELTSPVQVEGTDIYAETWFSKNGLMKQSKKVISLFGYPEDAVSFSEEQE